MFAVLIVLGAVLIGWAAISGAAGGVAALVAEDASDVLLSIARTLAELGAAFVFVGLLREWAWPRLLGAR